MTARREDDLATALRLAEEFELRLELTDAVEGYLMTERIREAGEAYVAACATSRRPNLQAIVEKFPGTVYATPSSST